MPDVYLVRSGLPYPPDRAAGRSPATGSGRRPPAKSPEAVLQRSVPLITDRAPTVPGHAPGRPPVTDYRMCHRIGPWLRPGRPPGRSRPSRLRPEAPRSRNSAVITGARRPRELAVPRSWMGDDPIRSHAYRAARPAAPPRYAVYIRFGTIKGEVACVRGLASVPLHPHG